MSKIVYYFINMTRMQFDDSTRYKINMKISPYLCVTDVEKF